MKRLTTEQFIQKAIKVHNNRYDYSLVEYKTTRIKIKIICPVHGIFEQVPNHHLNKRGCPRCTGGVKLTTEQFIQSAKLIHDNKYDYSLVEYKNSHTKIKIICPVHGIFEQVPRSHLKGNNCFKCASIDRGKKLKLTTEQFIQKAIKVHGSVYNYSLVEYISNYDKVKIICSEHGEFFQTPNNHLNNKGCPICGKNKIINNKILTTEEFINKAIKVHCWKYNYKLVSYKNNYTKVKIICPVHGIFEQRPDDHLKKSGCPKCTHKVSKPEKEICSFLDKLNVDYKQSDRSILEGKELDIVIHSKRLAIEFNGIYWHSEQVLKNRNINPIRYHQHKYLKCKQQGYQLISIFEPEWILKKDIIKSIIKAKLNIYETKIGGRNCKIKLINSKIAKDFFNENHIQGFVGGNHIGLYYKNRLVSAISFRKNNNNYELVRFVNKKNTLVHGAFSKLLKYFINNYLFESIYTFADLRYFEGSVYEKNGFKFVHEVNPSYYYFKGKSYILHKRAFQKKILKKKFENYNSDLTEYENCLNNGYDRIWDCGKLKFELKRN